MKLSQPLLTFLGVFCILLAFFSYLFGLSGIVTLLGIAFFFILPFFFILSRFFSFEEALFFSFFVGIGMFATLVYNIAFVVGIKLAIAFTLFIILIAAGILYKTCKKKYEINNRGLWKTYITLNSKSKYSNNEKACVTTILFLSSFFLIKLSFFLKNFITLFIPNKSNNDTY